ncbi:ethanolamine permease [Clostridium sp. PL3]|uniref:Ethanolamine permease n=1 Tax=Clostridium thailandense TaxID=2794346 RepID=A0A949WPJ9_9CLOT|nr:ethanolamine permease [Clostridium thailandense]MBV7271325.1 ethanolamine permease [Clostridium thailandense]
MSNEHHQPEELKRVLKPIHLWAISVGMVISGQFFGWSYGLDSGGPIGLIIAVVIVTIFYATFMFSYVELSTSIPHAGGPSAYARKAMGPFAGFMAGFACLIEMVFAPPAIALGVGGYIHFLIPAIPAMVATVGAFVIFIILNCFGVKTAAVFELAVTVIAIIGVILFDGAGITHINPANIITTPILPHGLKGILAATPFAIWFYLAIEGGAMSAEEVENPKKDIPKGFIGAILTLMLLTVFTLLVTAGIANYATTEVPKVDFPLPLAIGGVYGATSLIARLVSFIGLFGLIASLNGIILGFSRQTFALARSGYLPKFLAYVSPKRKAPIAAIVIPGVIGIISTSVGLANLVIQISALGAVVLYIISMISLFKLRKKYPDMERPYKVAYPIVPGIALVLGVYCAIAFMVAYGVTVLLVIAIFALAAIYYAVYGKKHILSEEEEFHALDLLDGAEEEVVAVEK